MAAKRVVSIRLDAETTESIKAMSEFRKITQTELIDRMLAFALSAKQQQCGHVKRRAGICNVCGAHFIDRDTSINSI